MLTTDLTVFDWTLTLAAGEPPAPIGTIDAEVPGCVHLDLLRHELIPDPYFGDNEKLVQWINRCDWTYACRFDLDPKTLGKQRIELRFEMLDTVASVTLNGQHLGDVANQHHAHTFDIKDHVRPAGNELVIAFRSPLTAAEENEQTYGTLPHAGYGGHPVQHPHNFLRKMSCNMGWDWGPVLMTCGVEGAVDILAWDEARIEFVRPMVMDVSDTSAKVDVLCDIRKAGRGAVMARATLIDPDGNTIADREVLGTDIQIGIPLEVTNPLLWWPAGQGDQPLYDLHVELTTAAGDPLDDFACRVGIRSVRLDQSEDETGSRFAWVINGREIFCKGANWIPDDCFPVRVTKDQLRQSLTAAVDAHVNMIRVWGGGLYASHDFYDLCDELGIMVAQDFMFACAMYPEEEPYRTQVESEAVFQLRDLARHASLIHWNGCNENIWGSEEWTNQGMEWKDVAEKRTWGAGYYFDLLPKLMLALDPTRSYTPGSPFSKTRDVRAQSNDHGTVHIWTGDYSPVEYKRRRARFVNEFGQQGPANYATLASALPADALDVNSPILEHHQKAGKGTAVRINKHLRELWGVDPQTVDFDTWHYAAQIFQARGVGEGVEYWRAIRPHCMGAVYWQWNDCWPVISWAALDSSGGKKLLWYATHNFFAPRIFTVQPADLANAADWKPGEPLQLALCNDTNETWTGEITIRRLGLDGREWVSITANIAIPPQSVGRLRLADGKLDKPADPSKEIIVVDGAGAARATFLFQRPAQVDFPKPVFEAWTDGNVVTVKAKTLLYETCLFADRLDPNAEADQQLGTLLPGESMRFKLNVPATEAAIRKPVLRCWNDWA
ncbi:MAG: glycoside hydrolase family 2 protein [Planctomycetota bacterium]